MRENTRVFDDTELVDQFASIFIEDETSDYLRDLQADIGAISIAGHRFPYSISDPVAGTNCYLCSPSTTYIDYALDELRNLEQSRLIKRISSTAIKACAPLVRASGLDHQFQLNNWLISTNPTPELSLDSAAAIRDTLVDQFPCRALVIRSLNEFADSAAIIALTKAGFKMLGARQIYIIPRDHQKQSRDAKRDAAMLKNSSFKLVEGRGFSGSDFNRCEQLYNALYLEKYTALNPHYTADFIREIHEKGIMRLVGLRDGDNGLVGFTGLFQNHGVLVQPFLGYDTTRPIKQGLYRMLMAIGRDHANRNNLLFNMSAGASDFKRNRGAVPAIEYTAVYVNHLSMRKRMTTGVISTVLRSIGVPLIRRLEL